MKIEVEEIDYCRVSVSYEADVEEIDSTRDKIVDYFKKAPVPGFRAGKATPEAIRVHYKHQIEESVKRALAEEAFHNTLFEKNLKPFGAPQFTSLILSGNKFTCSFKCNVHPTFTLGQYKGLEIPKPPETTVNEIAERMLQQLREQHGQQVPYGENDFIQDNDQIIINYQAFNGDEKVESLGAQGEMLKVGTSSVKEFDINLLGMKIGETRSFFIKVPEDGLPSVVGKNIRFEVSLISGSKIYPAGLDDDLAKKMGKETFAELRELVTQAATGRADLQRKNNVISQITAKLVDSHDFKIPDWIVVPEAQYLAQQSKVNWDTLPDMDKERFLKMGVNNAKMSLILDKIRDEEPDAQLSDQEVLNMLKDTFAKSQPGKDPEEILKELTASGYLQSLFVRVRDEHVLGYLADNAKIIE